ncbi:MAG: apolipoprotein N-acyltransferase [Verrucomicrobiota bacterium]
MLPPPLLRSIPWVASALSGLLLAFCFAPWNQPSLLWFVFLPLLWSLWNRPTGSPKWTAPLFGYLFGLVFFTTSLHWISALAPLFEDNSLIGLPLLLSSYLAVYPALWAWLLQNPPQKANSSVGTSFKNIAFALSGASTWVLLDWLRGWLFTGFGWNAPGVALHSNIALIQIADIFGVYGLSFLIVFTNVSLALVIRRLSHERSIRAIPSVRFELMVVLLLIGGAVSYGAHTIINSRQTGTPLRVICLQPNQPQDILFDRAGEDAVFTTIDRLMSLAAPLAPHLVLWPEAATPRGIYADQANHDFILKQAARTSAALLIGSVEPKTFENQEDLDTFNSALLLSKNATSIQSYKKRHLVPFGEYLPFRDFLPSAIRQLVPGDLAAGTEANLLKLDQPAIQIGALVCFEDSLARETRSLALAGAQILVNLTNDAWFAQTAGAAQHLANARFRAIETRLPLLRCANTGITCQIDRLGFIKSELAPFQENILSTEVIVPVKPTPTLYTTLGDTWLFLCLIAATPLIAMRFRKKRLSQSTPLA